MSSRSKNPSTVDCLHHEGVAPLREAPGAGGGGGQWEDLQANASSRHPDGVNVAFGDTHITFIDFMIDAGRWQAYGAAGDGQMIQAE